VTVIRHAELRLRLALGVILLVVLLASMNAWAQERPVRVAAAADLKFAMNELSKEFESKTGTKVDVTSGSSGSFFAQIQSGAPFDLFFSADMEYPKKLEAEGFVEPGTLGEYGLGQIVIWMPANTQVGRSKQGWNALLDPRVQKIAIANPVLAPYGRAAVSAMQKAGIYEQVKPKLVYGENISQAAQFVQSGNAQAGIIALSLALAPGMKNGMTWIVPAEAYPPIQQGAVMLKIANNKTAARAFLDFVRSASGRKILEAHGFSTRTDGSGR
jgi:molybdate transport system substrate-binding protein